MSVDPASLEIVIYPDPALREPTAAVDPADPVVAAVAARMIELMHEAEGVGLAAPQVGLSWRMFVTNARDADPHDRVFLNPELSLAAPDGGRSPLEVMEEGCLSLPGIHVDVKRPARGGPHHRRPGWTASSFDAGRSDAFIARVWQHEFDHLEGRAHHRQDESPIERLATRKALRALEAEHAGT